MAQGIVEKVSSKTGKAGLFYSLKIDNIWYSVFNKTEAFKVVGDVGEGDTIDFNFITKGDFKNITELKILNKTDNPVQSKSKSYNEDRETAEERTLKNKRITRMSCLNNAIELFKSANTKDVASDLGTTEQTIISLAEDLEKWVNREE